MKHLIIMSLLMIANSSAFAGVRTVYNHKDFYTEAFTTKDEAYSAGHDISELISNMSHRELSRKLSLDVNRWVQDVAVDDTTVTVKEQSKQRGVIEYKAIVEVAYHYKANEYN